MNEWIRSADAQQSDGYLNSCFTTVEPEKKFEDPGRNHELYCAGHLIEAAVAGYLYLGKTKLPDALEVHPKSWTQPLRCTSTMEDITYCAY